MNNLSNLYSTLDNKKIKGLESIYLLACLFYKHINKEYILPSNINYLDNNILTSLNDIIYNINIDTINFNNIINNIFLFYIKNDNLSLSKEYAKFYNNNYLIDYIAKLVTPTINDLILEGNIQINSFIYKILEKYDINHNNLYSTQSNLLISDINKFIFKSKYDLNLNIMNHNVLVNDIIENNNKTLFDIIYYDFSDVLHNIIHAQCCDKIKKLKIRGTKYEPLLIQLIMMSLNKNGKAVLIVPDMFFYCNSNQFIETRKYLVEHFNVKKICKLDDSLFYNKTTNKSLIYFENNGKTTNIEFINLSTNKEQHLFNINVNNIVNNNYILFYKSYCDNNLNIVNDLNFINFDDIFDITNNYTINNYEIVINKNIEYVLINDIYCNKNNNFMCLKNKNNNFDTLFLYYYLKYLLDNSNNNNNNNKYYNKQNTNIIDINKLKTIKIPLLNNNVQKYICNYYDIVNNIINNNNNNILMYKNIVTNLLKTIPNNNVTSIENIFNLYKYNEFTNNMYSNKIISITRNSSLVGNIQLYNNIDKSIITNNSYYLILKNNEFLIEYVCYYLKSIHNKFIDLASLSNQNCLSINQILSINIPHININNQKEIINMCDKYYNIVNNYNNENELLKNKDIVSIITKIYNII